MSRKTLAVDSDTIDLALDELSKLIFRLDKNTKKIGRNRTQSRRFNTRFGPFCKIEKERIVELVTIYSSTAELVIRDTFSLTQNKTP